MPGLGKAGDHVDGVVYPQSQQEDRGDRRREVALHALQVLVQPAAGDDLHNRNPEHAEDDEYKND
mgnify:CR=1 FL=1